jgi:mRNA interferase YafQ
MSLDIVPSSRFRRDLKNAIRRGYDVNLLKEAVDTLAAGRQLPPEKHDHPLRGEYAGCRECHITPDWLLIYEVNSTELILYLTRTGTHSDLFR